MKALPRLLGTSEPTLTVAESVQIEINGLIARAEELLKQLDMDQDARYAENARLSLEIQRNEGVIDHGAALARRLQQVRSVLEAGIEERDA